MGRKKKKEEGYNVNLTGSWRHQQHDIVCHLRCKSFIFEVGDNSFGNTDGCNASYWFVHNFLDVSVTSWMCWMAGLLFIIFYLFFLYIFLIIYCVLTLKSELFLGYVQTGSNISIQKTYAYRINFKLSPNLQSRMCNDVHKWNNTVVLRPVTCDQYVTLNMCIYSLRSFFFFSV